MIARPLILAALTLSLLAGLGADVRADEDRGLVLARQARRLLDEGGDPLEALRLLEEARLEWPDSDLLRHALADARSILRDQTLGRLAQLPPDDPSFEDATAGAAQATSRVLDAYQKAFTGPNAFRARFNSSVVVRDGAERGLSAAGVPLSPNELPDPFPGDPAPLIAAIDAALPQLEASRGHMLEALRIASDAAARESVAALTRRLDDLAEMKERLEQQQEEQEEDGEDDQEQDENEDGEQDEQEQDEQDEDQDSEQQDQEGEEPPPDEPEEQQPPEDPSEQEAPAAQAPQPQLTAAQMQELLDKLEALEEQALAMARERRARERESVEKDW